ncbi:MAG: hypothetical protein CSA74_11100 [Rhodobacterales bacterium]|nr:MAG: hypothetical protein CSA74_11100 [Rhodobacterales bacterium]
MKKSLFPQLLRLTHQSRRFSREEDGAVTVDWVVLTASIMLLGLAAGIIVGTEATELGGRIGETVSERPVNPG